MRVLPACLGRYNPEVNKVELGEDLGRDPGGMVNEWGQAAVTRKDRSGLRSIAMDSL